MPRIKSLGELNRLKVQLVMRRNEEAAHGLVRVLVGMGSCGIAAGASEIFQVLEDEIEARGLHDIELIQTGCMVLCKHEPIVEVIRGNKPKVSYGGVTPGIAKRILQEHVLEGHVVEEFVIDTTPYPTL